ncbi:Hypothetical predicted protein [Mytilus galloprovincialis]|uniref:Uncharacterized protein n=1 Tax=Mytilus galloprovincialis TaxID=29158 RepID=A0A8B6HDH5_MYTGA|nr:Hypothetical predicted protein [Mytilus galloprovincialis]
MLSSMPAFLFRSTSFFFGERRGKSALVHFILGEEDNFLDADEGGLFKVEESSMSLGRSQIDSPPNCLI